jgi:hypothetical protein
VVPPRIDDEFAEQAAVGADDPDVVVSDEELDALADVGPAEADVPELTEIADGHVAGLADPIFADPEVGLAAVHRWAGLDPAVECLDRRPAPKRPVRPLGVVVVAVGIELVLEGGERDQSPTASACARRSRQCASSALSRT